MEASAPVTTITMISTRQELMKREEIKTLMPLATRQSLKTHSGLS